MKPNSGRRKLHLLLFIVLLLSISVLILVQCQGAKDSETTQKQYEQKRLELKKRIEAKHQHMKRVIELTKKNITEHHRGHLTDKQPAGLSRETTVATTKGEDKDPAKNSTSSNDPKATSPKQDDEEEEEVEDTREQTEATHSSNSLLLIAMTIVVAILLTYMFLKHEFHYLPESIATIFVGGLLGVVLAINGKTSDEVFRLDTEYFFLVLLPPIIFESGYTLSKAEFFSNIGSITIFAVFGTLVSSAVIGIGLGVLGVLPWIDALVFGAILSAIDPVATLAVFQTIEVESTLSTLIFGESVLNDAISIVLYKTFYQFLKDGFSMYAVLNAFTHFIMIFFGSTAIGVLLALFTALVFKQMSFRQFPSLEISLMLVCSYMPYLIGEGLNLSGILCILANAIVSSHYTHFNLSKSTQITLQQTSKALSFISETIVFAYLGLAVFSYTHQINLALIIVTIILCVVSRAANIFPLSYICNKFRTHTISQNAQIVMWFSGLRGAIAFSLALTLPGENQNAIVTTTLLICLFSMIFLGGGTLPLLKHLYGDSSKLTTSKVSSITTQGAVVSEQRGLFHSFDEKYMRPFFCQSATTENSFRYQQHRYNTSTNTQNSNSHDGQYQ